jgi:CheY-like chemotaxis protein
VPVSVVGDPQRLRQVLINLLGNAVKFTERGTIRLAVSAPGGATGAVAFAVSDTGIGIPVDQLGRIFDDFTQADSSTTRRFGGTGLGLAISRRLVRLMGGELTAASTVGEGSLFTFTVALQAAGAPVSPHADPTGTPDRIGARPLAILVAEDLADNRLLIQAYLNGSSHAITFATDGQQAVTLFEAAPFDVVLMDVQMPVMDGLEATRRMRAFERAAGRTRTPVVAVTANAGAAEIEESRAAGCDAHLAKPLSKAALLAGLASATAGRSELATGAPAPEMATEFDDLVRHYLAVRRLELDELRQSLAAANFARLRTIGHNLAGTGASFGFPDLSRLGRMLEASARAEDRDGLARHVQSIEECLAGAGR